MKHVAVSVLISPSKRLKYKCSTTKNLNMPSLFAINGEVIEKVSEFTYLGNVLSNKDQENFTELRVSKAVGTFNEMRQVLTNNKVRMATRKKLMEACVRSHLTYQNTGMVHQGRLSEVTGELFDGNAKADDEGWMESFPNP